MISLDSKFSDLIKESLLARFSTFDRCWHSVCQLNVFPYRLVPDKLVIAAESLT